MTSTSTEISHFEMDRLHYSIITVDVTDVVSELRVNILGHHLFRQYLLSDLNILGFTIQKLLSLLVFYMPYVDIDTVCLSVADKIAERHHDYISEDRDKVSAISYQILTDNKHSISMVVDRLLSAVDVNRQYNYRLLRYYPETMILLGTECY